MEIEDFRKHGHELIDWIADYLANIRSYPVKPTIEPGSVFRSLPDDPPEKAEDFRKLFSDFESLILPGITHWQSPYFQAYFPANSSLPSLLAEMLTATLGAQCMMWDTSPAATELEDKMTEWLKKMLDLPASFAGVIQDTASTSTLCAIITARERVSRFSVNTAGFSGREKYRIYCSSETHSSIEKAVKIAGFGKECLIKIPVDELYRMNAGMLKKQIGDDIGAGFTPVCVVATLGTTGSTSVDPLAEISEICSGYGIWLHVDAAFAGTALMLEEYRWMSIGLEKADSFVFNPHKWMFTNFDCSIYFVRDTGSLIRTFAINPEYLKTRQAVEVKNYKDWGIQLGRRFRALKLWFVIRTFGIEGIKARLRDHILWAHWMENEMQKIKEFRLLAPVIFNTLCFHYIPEGFTDHEEIDRFNEKLHHLINSKGNVYLSHTRLKGIYTIRIVLGQTYLTFADVQNTWDIIREKATECCLEPEKPGGNF